MNKIFLNRKLIEAQGEKSENLHLMRFLAAIMVILSHAFPIATGDMSKEWFMVLTNGQFTMGEFAVSIFFLCGGYLIAKSVEKYHTAKSFFSARLKRLIPPLAFTVIVTIIIGAFISSMGIVFYVLSVDTWKYLLNILFVREHYLPGVFIGNPYHPVVNGSLWTLPVEFGCYVFCFIAYKLSFLKKKKFPFSIPLVILGSILVWWLGGNFPSLREFIAPVLLFYVGMMYWIYREYISLNRKYFGISILGFVVLVAFGLGQVAMLVFFPYIMMYLWFGMKQCSNKIGKLGNYSYGIYLWAFPIQQTVVYYWKDTTMPMWLNAVISIPISMLFGYITYEIAEKGFIKVWERAKITGFEVALLEFQKDIPEKVKKIKIPHIVFIACMFTTAMHHVNWGLDFWDTGYSYANFQYMGLEHMDYMWLFSTYLSNVVGNLLTKLPYGHTLLGMNFYTTMLIVIMAVVAYFFCIKAVGMSRLVAFGGVWLALGLCWCPSSVLYNYLTYFLFLLGGVFVFFGLTKKRNWILVIAGICLGMNVLTRFSNLAEMALIVAVWLYGVWENQEDKEVNPWRVGFQRTLWCLGGYLSGAGVILGYIHIRYGIDQYVAGITRLFTMTENATEYQPTNMVLGVAYKYYENLVWIVELLKYILPGVFLWLVIDFLKRNVKAVKDNFTIKTALNFAGVLTSLPIIYKVMERLYSGDFCELYFYNYSCIETPSVVFMMLTMILGAVRILQKNVDKKEKLFAAIVLLILFVSSIGGNNGVYTSFNNLFIAAPYTLWMVTSVIKSTGKKIIALDRKGKDEKLEVGIYFIPLKCGLIGFICVFAIQVWMFGETYFFTEATGAINVISFVENSETLKGIVMEPGKAQWMTELCGYVNEHELEGKELISYGYIPSLSYYLQMPPAFNAWVVLDSYPAKEMQLDLDELREQMKNGTAEAPVIILDKLCPDFSEQPKWLMLKAFMEENGYTCNFENGKFLLYERSTNND